VAAKSLTRRKLQRTDGGLFPSNRRGPADNVCIELEDHSSVKRSAVDFFHLRHLRDPQPQAARMAEQFIAQNRPLLSRLDGRMEGSYDGRDVSLVIHTGSAVGAVPLFSPTTARPDYGLVVQPRFPWPGIGSMLGKMGWRVTPTPLRLPLLHRSERRVPIWVLSSMILMRLKALLGLMERRFEMVNETLSAPRGRVDWTRYATRSAPRAQLTSIPCCFADLRDDRLLKSGVRYTLERQLRALETQVQHGAFVQGLLELCQQLLQVVHDVPPFAPSRSMISSWMQRPMRAHHFVEGLQAIEWSIDERGLGGLSDLEGLPWTMPMDRFFEAWVETVFGMVAQRTGGHAKVGRKRETVQPLRWDPPYLGSQKSLVPDIWLEWDSLTLIADAKYKRHWEELGTQKWSASEEQFREEHRNDLLQVLAYANLARTPKAVVCLAYPCSPNTWLALKTGGRLFHQAELPVGSRSLRLWLTAVPMATDVEIIAEPLSREVRSALQ
jgi:hypothetical protein